VDDAELVGPELHLAALDLAHRAGDVERHRAGLGVRHQAAWPEDLAQRAYLRHDVRRRDRGVEIRPSLGNLLDQIVATHEVGSRLLSLFRLVGGGEDGDAHLLPRSVRQDD